MSEHRPRPRRPPPRRAAVFFGVLAGLGLLAVVSQRPDRDRAAPVQRTPPAAPVRCALHWDLPPGQQRPSLPRTVRLGLATEGPIPSVELGQTVLRMEPTTWVRLPRRWEQPVAGLGTLALRRSPGGDCVATLTGASDRATLPEEAP